MKNTLSLFLIPINLNTKAQYADSLLVPPVNQNLRIEAAFNQITTNELQIQKYAPCLRSQGKRNIHR